MHTVVIYIVVYIFINNNAVFYGKEVWQRNTVKSKAKNYGKEVRQKRYAKNDERCEARAVDYIGDVTFSNRWSMVLPLPSNRL